MLMCFQPYRHFCHDEIAALVKLSIVVGEVLQLQEGFLLALHSLVQILFGLCLLLNLVDQRLGLLHDGGI